MKENGELKEVDYEVLGFDQGGGTITKTETALSSTAGDMLSSIASEDAKRIAKITAIDAKKENALRKKDAAAARLAAGVIPRKRAKNNGVIEPVDVEPVIEPDDADVEPVDD
jgi:hypothetical protein